MNPLIASVHSQSIIEDRVTTLENENECMKKLLRIEMEKNKEASEII